jgi:hypothetical protein
MNFRYWFCAGLLFAASGCHFDGSAYNDQSETGEDLAEPGNGDDSLVPKPPDTVNPLIIHAISETTEDGHLEEGSFEELEAMDDTYEMILAAVDKDVEKLQQRWQLGEVPAGQYKLAIAVEAYSPLDPELYEVSYRVGDGEWIDVFQFASGTSIITGTMMSEREEDIQVVASGELELRAKLIDEAPVVQADESGVFKYFPPSYWNGRGEDEEPPEPDPVRKMSVNYLSLQLTPATAGN